jgi:hypothetical protein
MASPVDSAFNPAEFSATMDRLRNGQGFGDGPVRPEFDPAQHREMVSEAVHGRRIDEFRQALERAGFKFYPAGSIPPGCEANGTMPARPLVEGQWRRPPTRNLKTPLAMTDAQVTSWFTGPEELWKWLTGMATKERAKAKRLEDRQLIRSFVPR